MGKGFGNRPTIGDEAIWASRPASTSLRRHAFRRAVLLLARHPRVDEIPLQHRVVLSAERDYDGWVFRALAFIEEGELVANFAAARASYRGGWGHRGRQANSSV
jgi:hypothetical protein